MVDLSIINRLQQFIESEGKSCFFNLELITPLYIYRMIGRQVSMEEIEKGLRELRKQGILYLW